MTTADARRLYSVYGRFLAKSDDQKPRRRPVLRPGKMAFNNVSRLSEAEPDIYTWAIDIIERRYFLRRQEISHNHVAFISSGEAWSNIARHGRRLYDIRRSRVAHCFRDFDISRDWFSSFLLSRSADDCFYKPLHIRKSVMTGKTRFSLMAEYQK